MNKFKYKAHKPDDDTFIEGEVEAEDRFTLSRRMREQGLVLISVDVVKSNWFDFQHINEMVVIINPHDKVIFANNLSAMISAGLSLSRSLDVLARQTRNVKFKRAIHDILKDVNSGFSLSASMARFPKIFSTVFVAMVLAGEESGNLPQSLKLVGDQLEKTYILRKKIKGAMAYPGIIFLAMIIVGVLMLTFIVPNLVATFKDLNTELPLSTQFIIALSNILINHWLLFLISIFLCAGVLYRSYQTVWGKRFVDFSVLHLPMISGITKQLNSATTARTLSSLVVSGVNIIQAIDITSQVLQNSYYKDVLTKAKEGVQKGEPLSGFFQKEEKLFPILVGELTEVGEETGKLAEMLSNVARFYEDEVDAVTKDMSTLIEPVLMIVIGLFVGFFAISMIQPIYSITEAI